MSKFQDKFRKIKPVLGMLHLKGEDSLDIRKRASVEATRMDRCGINGIIVENYFGTIEDVAAVLHDLKDMDLVCKLGVNILGSSRIAFELAKDFPIDFIQIDSVSGHLEPEDDVIFARNLAKLRAMTDAAILGGVRFKYMPVLSGRSESEDLELACERCDAIVVTSDATGQETEIDKIRRFRSIIGKDMPLIVGAGLTPDNVQEQFRIADGGIVGSWIKDNHKDDGEVDTKNLIQFLDKAQDASLLRM